MFEGMKPFGSIVQFHSDQAAIIGNVPKQFFKCVVMKKRNARPCPDNIGRLFFVFVFNRKDILGSQYICRTPKRSEIMAEANSVLHVKLDGVIGEKTSSKFDVVSMTMNVNLGLSDLLHGLEKAKTDKNVQGIFLELGNVSCGYATAKEIRNAINNFEESGKFVVAYNSGEYVGLGKYYISSAANELYGFPTSTMEFLGLGGELTFFKKTFDKLDIDVEIIRGTNNDFKSAVEPFFLEKMSDSSRLQMQTYVDNIWRSMREDIAKDRKISADDLNRYADEMAIKR
ncbi:peptidase, S49 family protein, partial [Ancylostoma ceylanicum]